MTIAQIFLLGIGDPTISHGARVQAEHPDVQRGSERAARAAAAHGKWWGIPTGSPEAAQAYLERGARLIPAAAITAIW